MRLLKLKMYIRCYDRYVFSQLKDDKHICTIMGKKGQPNLLTSRRNLCSERSLQRVTALKINLGTFYPV